MTFNEYQKLAHATSSQQYHFDNGMIMTALGLAGESGEYCDKIKKAVFHKHNMDTLDLILELGDILWYVSEAAKHLNITLERVAELNIEKLKERYPEGFSSERSINRKD